VKIKPINPSLIVDSLRKTRRLLVVEEGAATGGIGSELISLASEYLSFNIARLSNDRLIPCSLPAELGAIPGIEGIIGKILELKNEKLH